MGFFVNELFGELFPENLTFEQKQDSRIAKRILKTQFTTN